MITRFPGKLTVYLGRRDFVDNTVYTEPVEGVVLVDHDYLQGRQVFAIVSKTMTISWADRCAPS